VRFVRRGRGFGRARIGKWRESIRHALRQARPARGVVVQQTLEQVFQFLRRFRAKGAQRAS